MSLLVRNRVLVPIDFSDISWQALHETVAFVEDPTKIYVLHVLAPISPIEPGVLWETINDQTRQESVERVFYQRCSPLVDQGLQFQVVIGDPGLEIVNYAQKQAIDLIVIPSHGRTGISRFLLGSVAERVVRLSHCPVLVLKSETSC